MTNYWYFIECSGQCPDGSTSLLFVGVGSSSMSQRCAQHITQYAVDHHAYFAKVSQETDIFVQRLETSIGKPLRALSLRVSAPDLWKHLRANSRPSREQYANSNWHAFRKQTNLSYRVSCNIEISPLA